MEGPGKLRTATEYSVCLYCSRRMRGLGRLWRVHTVSQHLNNQIKTRHVSTGILAFIVRRGDVRARTYGVSCFGDDTTGERDCQHMDEPG